MEKQSWGKQTSGVALFRLALQGGLIAEITNYGGALVSLFVPDRLGNFTDIVLGYDTLASYQACTDYLGAIIGRHANRIGQAQFLLAEKRYQLEANDGPNHLHGGNPGLNKVIWQAQTLQTPFGEALKLSYLSPHLEAGYPGKLEVEVIYRPTEKPGFRIDYWAKADQDTVVNLTNHSYFNLAGHDFGTILGHEVQIEADFYTPIDENCLPLGEIRQVAGTPFDFRRKKPIGFELDSEHEQILAGQGYDHNWVLRKPKGALEKAARVEEPLSGRVLEVWTTKPGLQFYTGNFLAAKRPGKAGAVYQRRSGFCLETQFFPDSLNHSHFPSAILPAGQIYQQSTMFQFSVLDERKVETNETSIFRCS